MFVEMVGPGLSGLCPVQDEGQYDDQDEEEEEEEEGHHDKDQVTDHRSQIRSLKLKQDGSALSKLMSFN